MERHTKANVVSSSPWRLPGRGRIAPLKLKRVRTRGRSKLVCFARSAVVVLGAVFALVPVELVLPTVPRLATRVDWEMGDEYLPEDEPTLCSVNDIPWNLNEPSDEVDQRPVVVAQSRFRYVWPIANTVVTSAYGHRWDPVDDWDEQRKRHKGVDLRAAMGTPVLAAADGRVLYTKWWGRGGLSIKIDHGNNIFTVYRHLSRVRVLRGMYVRAGQRIGLSGASGRVTGPHLHFEFWENGKAQNPLRYDWRLESPAASEATLLLRAELVDALQPRPW